MDPPRCWSESARPASTRWTGRPASAAGSSGHRRTSPGTARPTKHDFLALIGADEAIDYTRGGLGGIRDLDVVLDLVGGDTAVRSLPMLRKGGLLVGVSSGLDRAVEFANGRVDVRYLLVEPDHCGLEGLADLVDRGLLRIHVAQTLPLQEAARAQLVGERGHLAGKLVLSIE